MTTIKSNLEKYMEKLFPGIQFLAVSDTRFLPGVVIESLKNPHNQGHIKSIIKGMVPDYWKIDRVKGNILSGESLKGKSDFSGSISLLNFLSIKSSLKSAYSFKYDIQSIEASNFLNTSKLDLIPLLREIKNKNKENWKSIKRYYVVTETFYASTFTVTMEKNGEIATKLDLEKDLSPISGDVAYKYDNSGKIIVTQNDSIPFGFWAFPINDI